MLILPRIRHQCGMGVLPFVSALLIMTSAACMAALNALAAGHVMAAAHVEHQLAFRAAEVALLDAEADILAALAPDSMRLAHWPAADTCGEQAESGWCRHVPNGTPPWHRWREGESAASPLGVTFGTRSGARMPQLPAGVIGATTPPRYLLEILSEGAAGTLPRFRVTALGIGRDPAIRVLLQTEFQP